jgi:hypothetical protein
VTTPLLRTTPEILSAEDVEVYRLPPIPTPPETISAPELDEVETVEAVTEIPEELSMLLLGL